MGTAAWKTKLETGVGLLLRKEATIITMAGCGELLAKWNTTRTPSLSNAMVGGSEPMEEKERKKCLHVRD